MPKWSGIFWLLIVLLLGLVACDEVPSDAPATSPQSEAILRPPTRTVKPIVSFTPRFTATPFPSATHTPSVTSTITSTEVPPTLTTTPSPTLTPTIEGVIQSTENVNLRSGPGVDYDIVVSASPGTELGVLNRQIGDDGGVWYEVAYETETGDILNLWVSADLVRTDFDELINRPPATTDPNAPTPPPAPTLEPNRVEILAYCQQKSVRPPQVTTSDNIYVEWSWFVAAEEHMPEHLEHANYEVQLDGEPLENWTEYATEMKREGTRYIIYWYYPVGQLSAGDHEITFRLTWDAAISDGYEDFGPGTPNEVDEGNCAFTVTEP